MTREKITARLEAWDEAIEHIDTMNWTDDEEERRQGQKLAAILRGQRDRWYASQMKRVTT